MTPRQRACRAAHVARARLQAEATVAGELVRLRAIEAAAVRLLFALGPVRPASVPPSVVRAWDALDTTLNHPRPRR